MFVFLSLIYHAKVEELHGPAVTLYQEIVTGFTDRSELVNIMEL
jgi:hypothetical protein